MNVQVSIHDETLTLIYALHFAIFIELHLYVRVSCVQKYVH